MEVGMGIYVKKSNEAVELYIEAFGLTLGYNVKNEDGTFYHSELYKGEKEVLSVVESPDEQHFDKTIQLGVTLDTEDEVRRAFDILRREGTVDMPLGPLPWSPLAASVIDKFGVWWYITAPQHRPDDDFVPVELPK